MTDRAPTADAVLPRTTRRAYLDLLRGVAVLVMVLAHTTDAWTRIEDRRTAAYRLAILIGGFGAPSFLFLAGITQSLSAAARFRATGDLAASAMRGLRHGLQIFALAFVFELQSWLISGGDLSRKLTRVDILHIMGLAMCATALLWKLGRSRGRQLGVLALAGVAVSLLTPIVVASNIWTALPDPIAFYVKPVPGRSIFSLFPWTAFFLFGAAFGVWLDSVSMSERRLQRTLLLTGTTLAGVAYGASFLPAAYAHTSFWTTSPTFFFIRLGILLAALAVAVRWTVRSSIFTRTLCLLGASSLFVYWVHVELVYGVPSRLWHHALRLEAGLTAWALLCAALTGLVLAKNAVRQRRSKPFPSLSGVGSPETNPSVPYI